MYIANRDQKPRTDSQVETYSLVSKIAYLAGVEVRIFDNPYEPLQKEVFEELELDRDARIIRNLCMLRTKLEQNFGSINYAMCYDMKNLYSLPEYVPASCLAELDREGINLIRSNYKLNQYLMDINRHICNRINNCKGLFPVWVDWNYIRELFIMPKGTTEQGLKQAAAEYYAHMQQYPYQIYLNWPATNQGNIFYNDRKFLTLLYENHEDCFRDLHRVSDAASKTKDDIYCFLEESTRAIVMVDCENADPYKFYGVLDSLNREKLLDRIVKIVLYNDIHASSAWQRLCRFTEIPVEHNMTERIKENKSLVDIQLTAGVCREHYQNDADAVILVSSDSDYWGLISMLPQVRFLVMLEESKCSQAIKQALDHAGIMYCYMDLFCMANTSKIMVDALLTELQDMLTGALDVNILELLEQATKAARATLTEVEKQQFWGRYIKNLRITFSEDGCPVIQLG